MFLDFAAIKRLCLSMLFENLKINACTSLSEHQGEGGQIDPEAAF